MELDRPAPTGRPRKDRHLSRREVTFILSLFLLVNAGLFLFLEATPGVLDRRGQVRGRDFLQFYIAGRIVADGEVDRLYDQEHFRAIQLSLTEIDEIRPPYFSTYPPLVSLLFSSFGRLPYEKAILIWWLLQAACFWGAGTVLFRSLKPATWRRTAWLGLAAFAPVLNTFWNGHLAGLLLLFFVAGFELHQRHRRFLAGCVLSLLALKPQLAVGVVVWLLLRRDGRALAGFCFGGLLQVAAVSLALRPEVLLSYARATQSYPDLFRAHVMPPHNQHAVAGIVKDLPGGPWDEWSVLAYLLVVLYSGILLRRVVSSRARGGARVELSAAVLFSLLATPHLATYDLAYLIIPLTYLISARHEAGDRNVAARETALYLCAMLTPFYYLLGFSLVPFVLVWSLHSLATHRLSTDVAAVGRVSSSSR